MSHFDTFDIIGFSKTPIITHTHYSNKHSLLKRAIIFDVSREKDQTGQIEPRDRRRR